MTILPHIMVLSIVAKSFIALVPRPICRFLSTKAGNSISKNWYPKVKTIVVSSLCRLMILLFALVDNKGHLKAKNASSAQINKHVEK